jgi:hypothetical protein
MAPPPDDPADPGTPSKGTTLDDLSPDFMAVAASAGAKTVQRFIIKFQYKPPATAPTGNDRGHLSTAATTFLSKVKLTHGDEVSFVSFADETLIDLQAMPTKTDADCSLMFKIVERPKAYRPSEIWIKLETALSFSAFKSPLFDFLRDNDHWLDLHGFGVQVTKIMRIGYVLDLDPRHLFREDYQGSVNRAIATHLRHLAPPDRTALFKKFRCTVTDPDRPSPKIRILIANNLKHPADKSSTPANTRALAVECPFDDRNIIEHFLMKFSCHPSGYFGKFINVSMTKLPDFVPQFRTLIASHNKRLTAHRAIPIAGISVHQMDEMDLSGSSLRDFLLDLDHIHRIERTPATPTLGKWLIFTTVTALADCELALDDHLATSFTDMLLTPSFPRFPLPTRLPTISPPMDYIATIMADAGTNLGSDDELDDHATLDNHTGNAWHRGPPKNPDGASTGSTITRTLAPTVTTQMDEIKILMASQQEAFNTRINSLQTMQDEFLKRQQAATQNMDKRFTEILSSQLDTLIDKALPRLTQRMDEQISAYFQSSNKRPHPPSPSTSPALSSNASLRTGAPIPPPLPPHMLHPSASHPMLPSHLNYPRGPFPGPFYSQPHHPPPPLEHMLLPQLQQQQLHQQHMHSQHIHHQQQQQMQQQQQQQQQQQLTQQQQQMQQLQLTQLTPSNMHLSESGSPTDTEPMQTEPSPHSSSTSPTELPAQGPE